ncbi:YggS family pyridoxal phosphate-dependent enzyme [Eikenella corrodens]|nr:YggS family pyridoxal phosphate-dependent enzyme [Eikenella corrodens]MDN8580881.1 YggS family pyridoxal phosphate-dependent enzyme [Eikenella corrodens]MDN8582015.1 YggS family pyridoxal phosphate-dependent enzyme [Eikenella corrodens]MDU4299531.1 YggS family pyridoxal phosphate-dependent enzyme [Eikenella corrodens]OAM17993.1 YggS family pyridoxal phosphate enzyme [Eikenella corrodens]OAM19325.1 YggS family pyridoxal phosphate enzyme [Eikenella corrodens]
MRVLTMNLHAVRARIWAAAEAAGRPEPELIAVSKTFPAADVRLLCQKSAQRDFGENYLQEFEEKSSELADIPDICWHIIGHIQSNKSRIAAERAHWVHTVDREKIARRLSDQRPETMPPLQVLIEVNIGGEDVKHGVPPQEETLSELAFQVASLPRLKLRGLMCVARLGSSEEELRQQFGRMNELLQFLQAQGLDVDVLSMGMSDDLETAVACGATHVRIGSAIFGQRDYGE